MEDSVEHIGPKPELPAPDTRVIIEPHSEETHSPLDGSDEAPIFYEERGCVSCCFGPIANMPFGWPKGSCSALMTYTAIICFLGGLIGVLVFGIITQNVNIILAIMGVNASGFSFAFGHYVGARGASKSKDKGAPATPALSMHGRRYRMIPVDSH